MTSKRAAFGIESEVIRIDGHQPCLLRGRRRETHGPGDIEHQIEINVGWHREAGGGRAGYINGFEAKSSHEIGRYASRESNGAGNRRTAF